MNNTRKNKQTAAMEVSYRDSIMVPGAIRIQFDTRSGETRLLGGAEEFCVFKNIEQAQEEISYLRRTHASIICAWEIQTLRADGLWKGCVAAGVFDPPADTAAA